MADRRPRGSVGFQILGGVAHLPGFARGWTVDLNDIDEADLAELVALLGEAEFFVRPAPRSGTPARDARTYRITADIDGRSRTLDIAEPFEDEALARFVGLLRRVSRSSGNDGG